MRQYFKKNVIWHVFAISLFALLALVFSYPAAFEGKVLQQGDTQKYEGMARELLNYNTPDNEDLIAWQGNMFSGMPSYHTTVIGGDKNFLSVVRSVLSFLNYNCVRMIFIGLVCFYILMNVLGIRKWLAIAGAIAFAFASYNIIIIIAGHITKSYVIAYMPLTIAGMFLLFRRSIIPGASLFTFGTAMSVFENHLQITYYLMLLCIFIYLGFVYQKIKEKQIPELIKTSAVMLGCVILSILPNAENIYANLEMSKTTTRGTTELTSKTTNSNEKISSGLDRDYAFDWSYEKRELLTLFIPNAYGGGSGGLLGSDSELYKILKSKGQQEGEVVQTLTYWGDKAFTAGPVYFGALICFLFVLGMVVVKDQFKWWLFAGGLFLTFLALGRHMAWFNDFMFHYLPIYNKFRTPETALVIPGLVVPIIALWGLKEIFAENVNDKVLKKGMVGAMSVTGGLALIIWLAPTLLLSFQSNLDLQYKLPDWYYSALIADRATLASDDAFRSLIFILLGAALIFFFQKSKDKPKAKIFSSIVIAALVLIDLWTVDKRYLNESNFHTQKLSDTYKESVTDREILRDTDISFRVLNLNNPFQETATSYFHKSIGGYHAAKLGRYQELIDHRLIEEYASIVNSFKDAKSMDDIVNTLESCKSLNMLNARYIIYNPGQPPIRNPFAYGNAWFVTSFEVVENADAEIAALNTIDPLETAVVDKRFADELNGFKPVADSTATIILNSYKPNRLIYTSRTESDQLAVFSEIYYTPGWRVTIDGKPASHFRANWTLRSMIIPKGEHEIVFEFYPEKYILAKAVSSYSSILVILLLLAGVYFALFCRKQKL